MEMFSYIIGGLNFLFVLIVGILSKIDDHFLQVHKTIKDEFFFTYKEFVSTISSQTIDTEKENMIIQRLKDLHYNSVSDISKSEIIGSIVGKVLFLSIILFLLAFISICLGNYLEICNKIILKTLFTIIIPFFILIIQLMLFYLCFSTGKYLKKLYGKYRDMGYRH